jgi:hypothetical protein
MSLGPYDVDSPLDQFQAYRDLSRISGPDPHEHAFRVIQRAALDIARAMAEEMVAEQLADVNRFEYARERRARTEEDAMQYLRGVFDPPRYRGPSAEEWRNFDPLNVLQRPFAVASPDSEYLERLNAVREVLGDEALEANSIVRSIRFWRHREDTFFGTDLHREISIENSHKLQAALSYDYHHGFDWGSLDRNAVLAGYVSGRDRNN